MTLGDNMDKETKRFFAELGIAAFGYLAEKKIKEVEEEGKKSTWTAIAHDLAQDIQDHPERYYDLGENLYKKHQKWKSGKDR